MELIHISDTLAEELEQLSFSEPVAYVYNPLLYARKAHALYLERFGKGPKDVVFLGMNPGPWGMVQTGVPFGEVAIVREWLKIECDVEKPALEHPKKVVSGFSCHRSEVSGRRLWGLFRSRFCDPTLFFQRFFVLNYCPLMFLDSCGRNITPDKLPPEQRRLLLKVCDHALSTSLKLLRPSRVIGIGNFAAQRIEAVLEGPAIAGKILHPSPANPIANRGWEETVLEQLKKQGVEF